jgi:hypothetical protein
MPLSGRPLRRRIVDPLHFREVLQRSNATLISRAFRCRTPYVPALKASKEVL